MKKLIGFLLVWLCASAAVAQNKSFQLSSHILDINLGKPASGVKISLSRLQADQQNWMTIEEKVTDENGRIKDFLEENGTDHRGVYKLTYHVASYFKSQGQETFYSFIEVVFEIRDDKHYHIPITLSPYGYSTYRGN